MADDHIEFILETGEEPSYEAVLNAHENNGPHYEFLPEPNDWHAAHTASSSYSTVLSSNNTTAAVYTPRIPWHPTARFTKSISKLHTDHYLQFPCLICVFCGRLLYAEKAKWILYNTSITYPISVFYPNYQPQLHSQLPARVPCCPTCRSPSTRLSFPRLANIPQVIHNVPYHKRRYLSPVFLQSSLGRAVNGNPYTQYRHIVGTMSYSRNIRCLTLYSGMIGAFLQARTTSDINDNWYDSSLLPAAQWLQHNNPYLSSYGSILERYVNANNLLHVPEPVWPTAEYATEEHNASSIPHGEVVIPNYDFPAEIHNEDAHYSRLMVGFLQTRNHNKIPLSFGHDDLEALLFPDLFPDGHGHFKDNRLTSTGQQQASHETYGKYIKHRLQNVDSRFRLHPTWPVWSYLQLEKLRNYQNTARLLRTRNAEQSLPQTAADLLRESLYTNEQIINEDQTDPLPTFIRTGDSYFREKQYHLDTMVSSFGLPTFFVTLTMAESKWSQLHDILAATDNNDTLPSNRPFHTTLHFIHRLRMLKKHIWKKSALNNWGEIHHFFERIEFQNRGAAHMHGCYWTSAEKSYLLSNNVVRSDLPDPYLEPELYHAVVTHQLHSCKPALCGGPAPPGEQCRKGFPRAFAVTTHEDPDSLRYIYECRRPEDQYVVPYHSETLLAWKAHINVQYVSTRGFAHYMVKYINKPEPSHVFNIYEGDHFHQHVMARRLGAMEVMFLTLGENICDSSTNVMYLTSEPPETRPRAIKPVQLLQHDNAHPFWDDTISKYFSRPHNNTFDNLTYEQYYMYYSISKTRTSRRDQVWYDDLNNQVAARKTPILVRYRRMRISDGEPYFYQLLLRTHSWRSETELYGRYTTYRDHYLSLHPDETEAMHNETMYYLTQRRAEHFSQFEELLDNLFTTLQSAPTPIVADLIRTQMTALYHTPSVLPHNAMAELPADQFAALNSLTNNLGSSGRGKYPFYFLTGPAGTGKSYVTNLFVQHLQRIHKKYLLLAPTGVAAQHINGSTIHSALRIRQTDNHYMTLAFHDSDFHEELRSIKILIIDEISMVSGSLLDFISNTFAKIHNNSIAFGGISVVVVGDLHQLPPVTGPAVFHASVWSVFHPLFLTQSHRQSTDPTFFKLLNEVRTGTIQPETWQILYNRYKECQQKQNATAVLTTTHMVGTRRCATSINTTICNTLPTIENQYLLSMAHDVIRNDTWESPTADKLFKNKTNLPSSVRLQPGARVMLLNNEFFDKGLCNGSIGFVTHLDMELSLVYVAFHVIQDNQSNIIHLCISKTTQSFFIDGAYATRTQFPLQNCFSLTVHKAQALTLPSINVFLNKQFFAPGHAYVALSRASTWSTVQIADLDPAAFRVDYAVLAEYARLNNIIEQLNNTIHS